MVPLECRMLNNIFDHIVYHSSLYLTCMLMKTYPMDGIWWDNNCHSFPHIPPAAQALRNWTSWQRWKIWRPRLFESWRNCSHRLERRVPSKDFSMENSDLNGYNQQKTGIWPRKFGFIQWKCEIEHPNHRCLYYRYKQNRNLTSQIGSWPQIWPFGFSKNGHTTMGNLRPWIDRDEFFQRRDLFGNGVCPCFIANVL